MTSAHDPNDTQANTHTRTRIQAYTLERETVIAYDAMREALIMDYSRGLVCFPEMVNRLKALSKKLMFDTIPTKCDNVP